MIIDSHCHLDFSDFDSDRSQVLQRAEQANIKKIIIPGVIKKTWNKIKQCCEEHPQLYPCYGLHPYFIDQHTPQDLNDLKEWVSLNKTIAIGECGLDYFLKSLNKEKQLFYFSHQLDLALELRLPVIIHARKSTEDIIKSIKSRHGLQGMIHSYSGSYEQAKQLIDLGFYLSFGGPVTYEKSTRLHQLIQKLPLESILVETDSPDQPTSQADNTRNEPACITHVIESIAKLRKDSIENIINQTTTNAINCFNL